MNSANTVSPGTNENGTGTDLCFRKNASDYGNSGELITRESLFADM